MNVVPNEYPTSGKAPLNGKWEWSPEEIRRVGYRVVDLVSESGLHERGGSQDPT